jgi:hypothetical protein
VIRRRFPAPGLAARTERRARGRRVDSFASGLAGRLASGLAGRGAAGVAVALAIALVVAPRSARAAGALETVTQGAASSLGGLTATLSSSVVVAAPIATDDAAPRGDELALRVAALVAGRLGPGVRAHPQTAQLATARVIAGRASALVYVQTAIAQGDLRTTVDVYPPTANAWDRIRNPLPSPTGHGFATAKIDAEVRAFLAPLLLESASVDRAHHDEGDVLAAACGDVDGDGGNELVLVSAQRVAMGRIRDGRFVPDRTAAWDAIGPRAPVPMREPLAGAAVVEDAVDVGSTARGGVRLDGDLRLGETLVGLPAWGGDGVVCLVPEPSAGAFDGAPVGCDVRRDPKPAMAVPAPRFDAFGAADVADADGHERLVVAVREPSGRVRLKAGDATSAPDSLFGAQLAVGDLDQDGQPEVVTSTDLSFAGSPGSQSARPGDGIDIASWTPAAPAATSASAASQAPTPELRVRLHLDAPAGVRALAMCPPEEHGEPSLIAVVGSEIWVVRAAVQR